MKPRTLPFWIRRKFVELPDREFDALHEEAHAIALRRLKIASAVLGTCAALAYVYWAVSSEETASTSGVLKACAYGVLMGCVAYASIGVLFVGTVLRCANRILFLQFAERLTKARGAS